MSARVAEAADADVAEVVETIRGAPPAATPPPDQDEMPLPTEPRTIFLGGLFLLALLAALYVASPIVLPVVLAIVLKLLLQPLVRLTDRAGLPRGVGAILALFLLVFALAALVSGVAGPAASWAAKLPEAIPKIQEQLAFLARPIGTLQWMVGELQSVTGERPDGVRSLKCHGFRLLASDASGVGLDVVLALQLRVVFGNERADLVGHREQFDPLLLVEGHREASEAIDRDAALLADLETRAACTAFEALVFGLEPLELRL